jgi:hypothetical protein
LPFVYRKLFLNPRNWRHEYYCHIILLSHRISNVVFKNSRTFLRKRNKTDKNSLKNI